MASCLFWLSWVSLAFPALAAGGADEGAALFAQKCAGCHTIGRGALVGPDLAKVSSWSAADAESAVKRMQKMAGPLTENEIDNLVGLLKDTKGGDRLKAQSEAAATPEVTGGEAGSAQTGRRLFDGRQSFANGGMACIACHTVGGSGSSMGPDLSGVAAKMGETSLLSACEQTAFKVMKAAYAQHPVTKQEALHLVKYFVSLKDNPETAATPPVTIYGVAGATLLMLVIAWGYRDRNGSARSKLHRR